MPIAERRAVAIVNAALAHPQVLLVESPMRGLDRRAAEFLSQLLWRISATTKLAFSCDAADDQAGVLLDHCSEVVVLQHGAIVAQGPPKLLLQSNCYLLRALSGGQRLATALREAGMRVDGDGAGLDDERPATLWVELARGSTARELAEHALSSQAEVIEVVPMQPVGGGAVEERAMAPE
jgi:ABC-type multidrug transport system ATPase subunit